MMYLNSKHGAVTVYAQTIEQEAIAQLLNMANSPLGENAHMAHCKETEKEAVKNNPEKDELER